MRNYLCVQASADSHDIVDHVLKRCGSKVIKDTNIELKRKRLTTSRKCFSERCPLTRGRDTPLEMKNVLELYLERLHEGTNLVKVLKLEKAILERNLPHVKFKRMKPANGLACSMSKWRSCRAALTS